MESIIPAKISAGITFDKLAALSAYPAPAWALRVILRGPSVINVTATAESAAHRVTISATDTAAWAAGRYMYAVRMTHTDGTVRDVESGQVEVLPDLAAIDAPTDPRSANRRTLEAIIATIEKRASKDQERYKINERELWRTPIADLLKLRGYYAALCRAEDARARGCSVWGPAVKVRF